MHIVVFGATGQIGRRIVREALERGHRVTGVVRDPELWRTLDLHAPLERGDATDAASVARVARGADAVVSAISPRPGEHGLPAPSLVDAAHALIAGARRAGVRRLVVVGGAGSLETAPGALVVESPDFPEAWKPEAYAHRDALAVYRAEGGDIDWTFVSPAALIEPGARTGRYRAGGDRLLVDEVGNSRISMEDYAVALLDELEHPRNVRRRMTVAY